MGHDSQKVLMGSTKSSYKVVDSKKGVIAAGTAVRLKSDDTIVVTSADGSLLGISLGKDLSDIGYTSICRKGVGVPVLLTAEFNPTVGAQVHISNTTGLAIASGGGATGVNAVYASGRLTNGGVAEDGSAVGVALIDFPGGL
jgi:hypothetical protein